VVGQLLEESWIWSDGSGLADGFQSLGRGHAFAHHEVGGHHGGGSRPAHHAVDDDETAAAFVASLGHRFVDELGGAGKVAGDVGGRMVVDVEAVVGDAVERVLVRVDRHVTLGRVQDVSDPDPAQVVDVLDGVAVAQDDARVDLVAVDPNGAPLVPVGGGQHARHHSVLARPRVDDGVDQIVARPLPPHRG